MSAGTIEPRSAVRSPGHSGGAVPELHRSSLFARGISRCSGPPVVRERSLRPQVSLSTWRAAGSGTPVANSPHDRCSRQGSRSRRIRWQSLPVMPLPASKSAACEGGDRTTGATALTITLSLTGTPKSLAKKYLAPIQALFPRPPIAPVSPGASLCPSGNQGGGSNLSSSSHGLARQACRRKEFVDHTLGVTKTARSGSIILA